MNGFQWFGLLGDFGDPAVPWWWAKAIPGVQLTFSRNTKKKGTFSVKRTLLDEVNSPRALHGMTLESQVQQLANSLGEQIERFRGDFTDAPLAAPSSVVGSRIKGSELPISVAYADLFDATGLGDLSVLDLSEIPIEYLLERGFDWYAVLDLSYILSHGLGHAIGYLAELQNDHVSTLEDSAQMMAEELWIRDGMRMSDDRAEAVQQRLGLGCRPLTLDQMGYAIGVTRERARQLEQRYLKYLGRRRWPLSPPLERVIAECLTSEDLAVLGNLESIGASDGSVAWNREMLIRLVNSFGYPEIAAKLEELDRPVKADLKLKKEIRAHRNKIGFMDLRTFKKPDGTLEDPDVLFKHARDIFSHSFREGPYALLGDSKGTQAENAVRKQFSICSEISSDELVEGIDRVRRNRGYADLPPKEVVVSLLEKAGAIVETKPGCYAGQGSEIEGDLKRYLVDFISSQPDGLASRADIFKDAVENGFSPASLTLYLTYDPLIRKVEGGLVRLVGSVPSQQAIESALIIRKTSNVKGQLSYEIRADGTVDIECLLGTSWLNSGVLNPSTPLRSILNPEGYSLFCCDSVTFSGTIKLSESFWYGFQPIFNHLRIDHDVVEGDMIRFELRKNQMRITEILK